MTVNWSDNRLKWQSMLHIRMKFHFSSFAVKLRTYDPTWLPVISTLTPPLKNFLKSLSDRTLKICITYLKILFKYAMVEFHLHLQIIWKSPVIFNVYLNKKWRGAQKLHKIIFCTVFFKEYLAEIIFVQYNFLHRGWDYKLFLITLT